MNFLNEFITRPDIVKGRISELENMSKEITQTEKQRESLLLQAEVEVLQKCCGFNSSSRA